MRLNNLYNIFGSVKKRKRVARGNGSGTGRTGGRGEKGQKSRSGVAIKKSGEQTSLVKRLPKRGFRSLKINNCALVSTDNLLHFHALGKITEASVINENLLLSIGIIKSLKNKVKILAGAKTVQVKFVLEVGTYSKSARVMIENAGGQCK